MFQQDQNNHQYRINRVDAILSLNRALIGEVFSQLRAAKIQWDDETVSLFFYYDGEISEENQESLECVATEVIADFSYHKLEVNINRCDYPICIPQSEESNIALVYRRKEVKDS